MSNLSGFSNSAANHTEISNARMNRDHKDLMTVVSYLKCNSPFRFVDNSRLVSLTGFVARPSDNVNCEDADEIGNNIQMSWNDKRFVDLKLHKSDQVKTLSSVHGTYAIDKDNTEIEGNSLFQRLTILAQQSDDAASCFDNELPPFPASLFKDGFMRKPDKPSLYRGFAEGLMCTDLSENVLYVVDGGCLLHKIRWQKRESLDCVMKSMLLLLYDVSVPTRKLCLIVTIHSRV